MIRRNASQLNNYGSGSSGTPLSSPPRGGGSARFEATSGRAIQLAQRRKWTLVGTLTAVLLGAAGFFAWHQVRESRDRSFSNEFLAVEQQYQQELESFQSKVDALPKEKQADAGEPDHSASAKRFEELAKKAPNHPLGWQAALRAAAALVEQGKGAEAAYLLELVLPGTRKSVLVQTRVRRTLANIYADLKEYDKAIGELSFIEKLPDAPGVEEAKLFRAQVLYLAGRKDEAKQLLVQLSQGGELGPLAERSIASEAALWLNYWGL